jgi:hypothetical protein
MQQARGLAIASLVFGSIGFALFLYCKFTRTKAQNEKFPLNMISKLFVALGVFLLAGAVVDLTTPKENYTRSERDEDEQ